MATGIATAGVGVEAESRYRAQAEAKAETGVGAEVTRAAEGSAQAGCIGAGGAYGGAG